VSACGCEPQADPERWHRTRGTTPCDDARRRRREAEAWRDEIRKRRLALAQAELAPDDWAARRWVPGTAIYLPEEDPC
jgi:hypothetical protein